MAAPRAHLLYVILAPNTTGQLVSVPGATVNVYQPGSTTVIAQTMYTTLTGSTIATNPLTSDANGTVEAWVQNEETVDLNVVATGFTTVTKEAKFDAYAGG